MKARNEGLTTGADRRRWAARTRYHSLSLVARSFGALTALVLMLGSLITVRRLDTANIAVAYTTLVVVWPLTMLMVGVLGSLTLWVARRPWRYTAGWVVVCIGSVPCYLLLAPGAASVGATIVNLTLGVLIVDAVVALTGWVCLTDQAAPVE
jgi:hypothetical protein